MDVNFDGIVITTNSWKCLPLLSLNGMKLHHRLECDNPPSSWVKGSLIASSPVLTRIRLAEYSGLELNLVLRSDRRLTFRYTLSETYTAIYEAINDPTMRNSNTFIRYNQLRCKDVFTANPFIIFLEDIKVFGDVFHQYLDKRLSIHEPIFVLCRFGQSAPIERMMSLLSFISSTEDVCEIIIHVAYDIRAENGKTLLWNRNSILETIQTKNLYFYEYYVCGIPGFGNFTFESKKDTPIPICGSTHLRKIKFYSSLAKYISSQTNVPFTEPIISKRLLELSVFDNAENRLQSTLTSCMEDVHCVRGLIENITTEEQYARCELIVNAPIRDTVHETLEDVRRLCDSIVEYINPIKLVQQFSSLRIHVLMDQTVGCCLDTIYEELETAKKAIETNTTFTLSIEKYKTLLACEAIICFMLRGTARFKPQQGFPTHENSLLRILQVLPPFFRESYSRSEYIFRASSHVLKEENRRICFTGPSEFFPVYLKNMKLNQKSPYTFGDLFSDLKQRGKLHSAAKAVADFILASTIYHLIGKDMPTTNVSLTHRSTRQCQNITIGSGYEAAKLLLQSTSSIVWILQESKNVTQAFSLADAWDHSLALELEYCGFKWLDFVCFNYGELGKNCIVVLPYSCLTLISVERAVPIWVKVISSFVEDLDGLFDESVLAAKVEVILQRSVEKLTTSQRSSIKLQHLIAQLFQEIDDATRNQSDEYSILFQEPFPVF